MKYEIGKFYTFDFKEKYVGNDGNIYLHLTDPDNPQTLISVKPFSFQRDWDDISPKLECFCYKQDIYGNYRFELSRWSAFNYMYGPYLGHYNEFIIEKRIETGKEKVNCCVISDEYGLSQRYYNIDKDFWVTYKVGDPIILVVVGIHPSKEGKNDAYLELEPHKEVNNNTQEIAVEQSFPVIRDESLESLGIEDDHTEFKASIVFPAEKKGEKDMATQLAIIMKSIAGFMNKDGGTLYIGVNDSGEPFKDIKEEIQYLNDDENDRYTYRATEEQYKLKINNKICLDLGKYAASLATVKLKQANGVTYAAIEIKKSESVVWYHGIELYVRCDNATRRMTGDGITKFILSRVNIKRFNDIVNQPIEDEEETPNEVITKPQEIEENKTFASQNDVMQNEIAWRYVSFFKNGKWSLRKTPFNNPEDLVTEISIPQNPKSYVMMIAYASGRVNAVELRYLLFGKGKKQNTLIACDVERNYGLTMGNDPVVKVFCMKKGGLVLMESFINGETNIRAYQMDGITTHDRISAQGVKMLSDGKLLRIAPIKSGTFEMDVLNAMGVVVKDYVRYVKDCKHGANKAKLQGKYQELIDKILG